MEEHQQKVISNLENTKLKITINTRQRTLHEFISLQTDTSSSSYMNSFYVDRISHNFNPIRSIEHV